MANELIGTPGGAPLNIGDLIRGKQLTVYRAAHPDQCGPYFINPGAAIDAARGGRLVPATITLQQIARIQPHGSELAIYINPTAEVP